jgi:uracil-DNA glycosylase family 4
MPRGFFEKEEIESTICGTTCKLNRSCKHPNMPVRGQGKEKVLVISGTISQEEDACGDRFVGAVGQYLQETFERLGFDLCRDCWTYSAVNCCALLPSFQEIQTCRKHVLSVIRELKPKVTILLGNTAIMSVIGSRWKRDAGYSVDRWRGWRIPDAVLQTYLCPVYSPEVPQRHGMLEFMWVKDLAQALALVRSPFPLFDPGITGGSSLVKKIICETREPLAVDYETSGVKPDKKGHFIRVIGVADSTRSAACLITQLDIRVLQHLLLNVPKIGHNIKYEERWSRRCLDIECKRWLWCTMTSAHIFDNRKGILSLKFQGYVHFGVCGYEAEVDFGTSDSNSINNIKAIPASVLCRYCAMDCRLTKDLAKQQGCPMNVKPTRTIG